MRLKKTKALRYVVATFLTMGTVLSVGFLSFSGLWIIYPYIIPAILAFFLSGVVEGKVFGTGIFKGLARLKLLSSKAPRHLFILELNQLIKHKQERNKDWIDGQCEFLKNYWMQREYYKSLKKVSHVDESKLKEAKKRLEELKDYFYQQINDNNFKGNEFLSENLKDAGIHLLKSAKRSVGFLRFFWIVCILVGVASGFVTAFAVHEAITVGLALSLSATALAAIVWPIAIFAAIGATFLLYYAITDIVKNDAIAKALNKTVELFKRKLDNDIKEPLGAYLVRCLALSLVVVGIVSLTLFATAASGGTCWIIMRKGIVLLVPKVPIFVAYCTSVILIPINFATDLIYGFSTTIQTINNLKGLISAIVEAIKHPMQKSKAFFFNIKEDLSKVKTQESWGQFFNPFRILSKLIISPLQSLFFIGHLISIGLTTDRFFNVPPVLVASVCASSEGLQDLSFLTTEDGHCHDHNHNDGHDHNQHDGHDHGNLLQLSLQVIFSPLLLTVGIFYWLFKKCGNEVSFFDAIKQTFELPLLNILFFPLLLSSAIWHRAFKNSSNDLTFYQSIKKSFDIHTHDHNARELPVIPKELSAKWREEERINWILATAEKRLNKVWIDKNNATAKQKLLKDLLLDKREIINYIKENKTPNDTFEEILDGYFKEKLKKQRLELLGERISQCLDGDLDVDALNEPIKNLININSPTQQNGNSNGNTISKKEQSSPNCTILQSPRSFCFFGSKTNKETMTSLHVKDAFSLVIPNAA
jgi:hypothetical protein